MTPAAFAICALLGAAPAPAQAQVNPEPGLPPLAVLLGAEVDDLDRDLGHQRVILGTSRQRLAAAQRLATLGATSQDELEQEAADARFQEARVGEMAAVRDLKVYQRDLLAGIGPGALKADPAREYALVLAVLKSQEATAQIEVDFRTFRRRQAQALHRRNAISRESRAQAELETDTARASVALLRARRSRLTLEFARRPGAPRAEVAERVPLEIAYRRALVDHGRLTATIAHARADLALARDRVRPKGTPAAENEALSQAAAAADAALTAELNRLEELEATPPRPKEGGETPAAPDRKPG